MTKAPIESLGVIEFARAMSLRHPELHTVVTWPGFSAMAARDRVSVRVLELSRPARLLRLGNHVGIQLNRELDRTRQTREGMHELCHFWRDDLGESCLYSDEETLKQPREDFAETFAWYVTSPARVFMDRPRSINVQLRELVDAGVTNVRELSRVTSQPEQRVEGWLRGRGKPDVVTAQYLRRYLVALKRGSHVRS